MWLTIPKCTEEPASYRLQSVIFRRNTLAIIPTELAIEKARLPLRQRETLLVSLYPATTEATGRGLKSIDRKGLPHLKSPPMLRQFHHGLSASKIRT